MAARRFIDDVMWSKLEPLLPRKSTKRGRPAEDTRRILEGIIWIMRTGAPWRDMPDEDEERSWCERARDLWIAGGARGDGKFAKEKVKTSNAWAARKAKKKGGVGENGGARNPGAKPAEEEES